MARKASNSRSASAIRSSSVRSPYQSFFVVNSGIKELVIKDKSGFLIAVVFVEHVSGGCLGDTGFVNIQVSADVKGCQVKNAGGESDS